MNIISEQSLQSIFKKEKKCAIFQMDGNCCICGKKVEVKVIKESAGFGLLGGILYESGTDKLTAKCIDCKEI